VSAGGVVVGGGLVGGTVVGDSLGVGDGGTEVGSSVGVDVGVEVGVEVGVTVRVGRGRCVGQVQPAAVPTAGRARCPMVWAEAIPATPAPSAPTVQVANTRIRRRVRTVVLIDQRAWGPAGRPATGTSAGG
jgi:hypothetical protein